MPFLFPALTALAALAAVPILIHLLNRRRYKRVVWAAMHFLREALREEAKRIQYKDFILMALRALVCILLALAIARPITRLLGAASAGNRSAVFILDRSASMSFATGVGALMDQAKREAISILRELPPDTVIALVDAARPATVVIPRTRDLREVEKAIADMEASDFGTDIAGAVRLTADLLREMGEASSRDVFLVSDRQATAWRASAAAMRRAAADFGPGASGYVVPVDAPDTRNLAVTDLRLDPPVAAAQGPFAADVDILNGGPAAEENIVVDLLIDGAKVATTAAGLLAPGASARLRILAEAASPGARVVEAIVNQGSERFSVDDRRRAILPVVEGLQALLVDGEPGSRFGQGEADYVDAVLAPAMEGDIPPPFAVTKIAATDFSPKDLTGKDLIVLCNVPALKPELAAQLRASVERGAGLLVFPGGNVSPAAYAALASPEPAGARPLLPAAFGKPFPLESAGGAGKSEPVYLSAERLEHEWMAFFRLKEHRPLLRAPVRRALTLALPTNAASRVVAWYENGEPAIVEQPFGLGRAVVFGTTADPDWNALFLEPAGAILVTRIVAGILPGSGTVRTADAGQRIQLPLPPEERKLSIRLTTPDNKVLTARPEMVGDRPCLIYEGRGRTGTYRYRIESSPPREELFALNLPADESDIRPLPAAALRELFPAGEFRLIQERRAASAGKALRDARLGRELWWPVLLLAFLALIGEFVYASLITPEAPSADELPPVARSAGHRMSAGAAAARGGGAP
jgi:hypothetical protein